MSEWRHVVEDPPPIGVPVTVKYTNSQRDHIYHCERQNDGRFQGVKEGREAYPLEHLNFRSKETLWRLVKVEGDEDGEEYEDEQ